MKKCLDAQTSSHGISAGEVIEGWKLQWPNNSLAEDVQWPCAPQAA